jgi:hypothetical protein
MQIHYFSNLVDEDCIRCEYCYVNRLSAKSSFCQDGSKYGNANVRIPYVENNR